MARFRIQPGQELSYTGNTWRIDRQLPDGQWQLQELATGRIEQIAHDRLLSDYAAGRMHFLTDEKPSGHIHNHGDAVQRRAMGPDDETLSEQGVEQVRARYTYVSELLADPNFRKTGHWMAPRIRKIWQRIRAPHPNGPPHSTTVMRWINRYQEAGGDARALAHFWKRKPHQKSDTHSRVTELLEQAIDELYLTRERRSMNDTLERARLYIDRENEQRDPHYQLRYPTKYQLRRALDERPAYDVYSARYGDQAARRQFRAVTGSLSTTRCLEAAGIDHTEFNAVALDDFLGVPLGRPTLAVCEDEFSRAPLGFYLGFEPEGSVSLAACLKHALMPKTELHEHYPQVASDWPCYGVMETLVVDQDLSNHSHMLEQACLSIGSTLHFAPRKTPWFKGKIERFIRSINENTAQTVPGTTYANIFEKGDYDPTKNAAVTLSTLRHIVAVWLVDIYLRSHHSALGCSPLEKWRAGLGNMPPPLAANPQTLDAFFTRPVQRKLDHRGVVYDGIVYNSPELHALRTQHGPTLRVTVLVDDGDVSRIYVVDPKTQTRIEVPALDQQYVRGLSRWSHQAIKRFAREEHGDAGDKALREARARIDSMIEHEARNTKKGLSKRVGRYLDGAEQSGDSTTDRRSASTFYESAVAAGSDERPNVADPAPEDDVFQTTDDDDLDAIVEPRHPNG